MSSNHGFASLATARRRRSKAAGRHARAPPVRPGCQLLSRAKPAKAGFAYRRRRSVGKQAQGSLLGEQKDLALCSFHVGPKMFNFYRRAQTYTLESFECFI